MPVNKEEYIKCTLELERKVLEHLSDRKGKANDLDSDEIEKIIEDNMTVEQNKSKSVVLSWICPICCMKITASNNSLKQTRKKVRDNLSS